MNFINYISLDSALWVVRNLEDAAIPLDLHVALGGSCLISGESNKDVDVFVYPRYNRTVHRPTIDKFVEAAGLVVINDYLWPNPIEYGYKPLLICSYKEKIRVDLFVISYFPGLTEADEI
ncbi:MAG: hypothetical protein HC840_01305 [Leptolyngbyaceae cyanobacterium RM2_2_4]|nr:hypothetical protein [Leptolyngbyaceae cyanobacterium RM2_2_4]